MNAFENAKLVEAQALAKLTPFLEEASEGHYVLTSKGNLARFLQETVGDVIFNSRKGGRMWSVECKAERKWTGNLFLELWSNRNLEDQASHSDRGSNPGWLLKTRADILFYYFLDIDRLIICNLFALKQWAFVHESKRGMSEAAADGQKRPLRGRVYDFGEEVQKQQNQLNDTRGRLVPVKVLVQEMFPPLTTTSVVQLMLHLEAA